MLASMALHDPERAAKMAKSFQKQLPAKIATTPWTVAINCISKDGGEVIDYLASEFLSTWIMDEQD